MTPIQFRVGCELSYNVLSPSAFIFNVSVVSNVFQRAVDEKFSTDPALTVEETRSSVEEKRHHRLSALAGPLVVRYSATVELTNRREAPEGVLQVPPGELPANVLPYLYPSRYCESDKLTLFTQQEFGNIPSGFAQVTAICNYIFDNIKYVRGSTSSSTSACDTITERAGVCRDFAHLGIAFCRSLGIPARFVSGYALDLLPPDFHAYFEAYLGTGWYIFDPTRLAPQTSFVRIGTGRDAADTSFATIFGDVQFTSLQVTMECTGGGPPEFVTDAISTS